MAQDQSNKKKADQRKGGEGFEGQEKTNRPDAMGAVDGAEQVLGNVNVVYGAYDLDMPLQGLTVEEIQCALKDVLNVDSNVEAYIDGNLVENKSAIKLGAGQRLEFMKEAGQKGVSR